jgi:hypothetical protein
MWVGSPAFADELVRLEAFESFKPPTEVVGVDEVGVGRDRHSDIA